MSSNSENLPSVPARVAYQKVKRSDRTVLRDLEPDEASGDNYANNEENRGSSSEIERLINEELKAIEIDNLKPSGSLGSRPKPKLIVVKPIEPAFDITAPKLPSNSEKPNTFQHNVAPTEENGRFCQLKMKKPSRLSNALAYGQIYSTLDTSRPGTPVSSRRDPLTEAQKQDLMTSILGNGAVVEISSTSLIESSSLPSSSVLLPSLSPTELLCTTRDWAYQNDAHKTTDLDMQKKQRTTSIIVAENSQRNKETSFPGQVKIAFEEEEKPKPKLFSIVRKQAVVFGRYIRRKLRKMSCVSTTVKRF